MTLLERIKKGLKPKQMAGLEIGQVGEACYYHLVVLEEAKGEINTLQTHRDLRSLEEVVAALGQQEWPLFLALNIRGILHKWIPEAEASPRALLEAVLPNAQLEEFYVQSQVAEGGVWASVVRRESIQPLLEQLAEQNLWVTGVGLGPFSTVALAPFVDRREGIVTTSHTFDLAAEGQLQNLRRTKNDSDFPTIYIEGEALNASLLPAFGSAFLGLLDQPPGLDIPSVQQQGEEFFQKRIFQRASWALLLGLLGLLVLNTFFFYQFKDQNQQLGSQVLYADAQLQLLDSLRAQVNRQEDFMQQTSLNQNSRTSFYADRIAASLPTELQLSELEVFPMQGKARDYREGQLIRYQKNRIHIKGYCKNSLTYNQWLKTLEEMDWVERAEHLEYRDLNDRLSAFELQLLIAPSK